MRIIKDLKFSRMDVHPAQLEENGKPWSGVHFQFESGEKVTMSLEALRHLAAMCTKWGGGLVEFSERDARLIGKGVVSLEDYPKVK